MTPLFFCFSSSPLFPLFFQPTRPAMPITTPVPQLFALLLLRILSTTPSRWQCLPLLCALVFLPLTAQKEEEATNHRDQTNNEKTSKRTEAGRTLGVCMGAVGVHILTLLLLVLLLLLWPRLLHFHLGLVRPPPTLSTAPRRIVRRGIFLVLPRTCTRQTRDTQGGVEGCLRPQSLQLLPLGILRILLLLLLLILLLPPTLFQQVLPLSDSRRASVTRAFKPHRRVLPLLLLRAVGQVLLSSETGEISGTTPTTTKSFFRQIVSQNSSGNLLLFTLTAPNIFPSRQKKKEAKEEREEEEEERALVVCLLLLFLPLLPRGTSTRRLLLLLAIRIPTPSENTQTL